MVEDTRFIVPFQNKDIQRNSLLVPVNLPRAEKIYAPGALVYRSSKKGQLVKHLMPYIPQEAVEILYDAGYETLEAIKNLNTDISTPNNDLSFAEAYTNCAFKPGHKKLILQYISNRDKQASEHKENPSSLLSLLEQHLRGSHVTKYLTSGIDYTLSVELRGTTSVGIWKCLICDSRPISIYLRSKWKQPQLSNVGTHLRTAKHKAALSKKNSSNY